MGRGWEHLRSTLIQGRRAATSPPLAPSGEVENGVALGELPPQRLISDAPARPGARATEGSAMRRVSHRPQCCGHTHMGTISWIGRQERIDGPS